MNRQLRIFLWIGLAVVLWLNLNAWMKDYGPRPAGAPPAAEAPAPASPADAKN